MWHAVGERVLVEALACLHIHLANQDLNELSKENKNTVLIPNIKCYMCNGRSLSVSEIWRQVGERVSEEVSHRDAKHLRVKYFLVVNTVSSMSELLPPFSPFFCTFSFCTFLFCTFSFCTFSFCTFLFCTFSFCTFLFCVPSYLDEAGASSTTAVWALFRYRVSNIYCPMWWIYQFTYQNI